MKLMKQLSFFLENKPGILAKVCKALAANGINIVALTVSDTVDHAVVRMVLSDHRRAMEVLEDAHILVIENDVLLVELKNKPGELGKLARRLGRAMVNIEYAYGCAPDGAESSPVVLRIKDVKRALKVLK